MLEDEMTSKHYLFYISQSYSYAILRPIQELLWARGDTVAWFLEGNEVDKNYIKDNELQLISIQSVIDYKPIVTFVPGNLVPSFIPGLKIAVFHGFNSGKRNRRGFEDHFNIRGCFDLYCTQGPNTTEKFVQLAQQHQHFSVKQTGWSALDPLFKKTVNDIKPPTILMCSTFSRNLTCAPHLFETIKKLSREQPWHWIVQFHPKMNKAIVDKYKSIQSDKLTFVETDNVIPLLQTADVMVCDTSSVLIMFLLQGKPVVTFKNISPKSYMLDIDDPDKLQETIDKAFSKPPELIEEINKFIKETHPYQDGMSAQRVIEAVDDMLTGKGLAIKPKPANLIRQFKMRKKLGYWKFW
jgi:hypothetical protein